MLATTPCSAFRIVGLSLLASVLFSTGLLAAPLIYNESTDGDLGPSASNPKVLDFDVGVNYITGTMGKLPSLPVDADFFTFALLPGELLTSISVVALSFPGNFYALQSGATIDTGNGSAHLFNTLVLGLGEIVDKPRYEPSSGSVDGFPDPLGAGTYTVWYQELGGVVNYSFAYTVTAIPEPASYAGLAGLGALALVASRRRGRPFPAA